MAEGFQFDKIYVLEGLKSTERKTGKELYDDLLRWKSMQITGLTAEYVPLQNKQDFIDAFKTIKNDVDKNGIYPVVHLELHGNKNGLGTPSGEFVTWSEIYNLLIAINIETNNNVFLTLGVCMGGYLMQEIKVDRECPFWGFVGSFDTLYNSDIIIRYTEFYTELFSSFDLNISFNKLKAANTGIPADYRFINSEQTFKNIYNRYLHTQFTPEIIKKRFEDGVKAEKVDLKDRNKKNWYYTHFKAALQRTKRVFFEEHRDKFFMIDKYPENREIYLVNYTPPLE